MTTKVLFVINGLFRGGAERMLGNLVSGLSAEYEPMVVSLVGRGEVGDDLERAGVDVRYLSMRNAPALAAGVVELVKLHKRFRPRVVSTWMYHSDFIGGVAAKIAGGSAICWGIHNSTLEPHSARRLTRALSRVNAKLSWRLPSAIVCCSEVAQKLHVGLGYDPARFVVIPNGFDTRDFRPDAAARTSVRSELGISPNAPLIGMIARWHPQKNHQGFLKAAAELKRRMPEAQFLLVGTDLTRQNVQLERMIREAGVGDAVHLLGGRADIPRLAAALDVATLSSISGEAFPMVLGEAMACGVPCVATDIGDSALIIGDTGRVVPPNDPVALARGWESLLALPPGERAVLGELARQRVLDNYAIESVRARYEAVFTRLARK
jgi:glycosyltransferase involved in cell wall biosynthesis